MPQIGWSEILVIILVAILVIGPKDLPVVIKKFEDAGLVVVSDGPEKFTKLVKFDDDRFSKLIRGMNLKQ